MHVQGILRVGRALEAMLRQRSEATWALRCKIARISRILYRMLEDGALAN